MITRTRPALAAALAVAGCGSDTESEEYLDLWKKYNS